MEGILFLEFWMEVAVPFVVVPQSSSHAGLLLVVDLTVPLILLEPWGRSPLTEGDGFTSGIPESVTVTPRFSSIFLSKNQDATSDLT
jgi:hypothetical protein